MQETDESAKPETERTSSRKKDIGSGFAIDSCFRKNDEENL